jgi:hypothetical protein
MISYLDSLNNTHAVEREIKDEKGVPPRFLVLIGHNMTFTSTCIIFYEEFVHINIQRNSKIETMLVLGAEKLYYFILRNFISCFARNLIIIFQIFPNRITHNKSCKCDNPTTGGALFQLCLRIKNVSVRLWYLYESIIICLRNNVLVWFSFSFVMHARNYFLYILDCLTIMRLQ